MRKSRDIGIAITISMISSVGSLYLALMLIDSNLSCLSLIAMEFLSPPRSFTTFEDDAAEGNVV